MTTRKCVSPTPPPTGKSFSFVMSASSVPAGSARAPTPTDNPKDSTEKKLATLHMASPNGNWVVARSCDRGDHCQLTSKRIIRCIEEDRRRIEYYALTNKKHM